MKSNAPSFIASTAVSTEPNPVMIMIGTSGSIAVIARSTSTPDGPSILRSEITKSGRLALNVSIPATPPVAVTASCPSFLRV